MWSPALRSSADGVAKLRDLLAERKSRKATQERLLKSLPAGTTAGTPAQDGSAVKEVPETPAPAPVEAPQLPEPVLEQVFFPALCAVRHCVL